MATLAAHDQENAVRNLQLGPGGKPLNAGIKAFGTKTPGNKAPKTPYKVPLNDENVFTKGGKGKGDGNLLLTTKAGGKLDANAFITPAGPRNRAPLGAKTTNAKGKAFQTPAPLGSSAKTLKASPRLRRPKVKVHQPEAEVESEDDVPEIEYMPPKEVPLLDDMDDYLPRDWDFSILGGENATRGITSAYHNPVEDDGRTRGQREFEESLERDRKKRDQEFDKIFAAQMAKDDAESKRYFGIKEPTVVPKPAVKVAPSTRPATGLSTMRAQSAAAALAQTDRSTPRFGASTSVARSRVPTGLISGRKTPNPLADSTASRQARHVSAVVSSKSTIGYAQGRAVRSGSAMRPPISNVTKPAGPALSSSRRADTTTPSFASAHHRTVSAAAPSRTTRPFSRSSSTSTNATLVATSPVDPFEETAESVERELELLALQNDEGEDVDAWMNNFNDQLGGADPLDEELQDFQLQLPEGF